MEAAYQQQQRAFEDKLVTNFATLASVTFMAPFAAKESVEVVKQLVTMEPIIHISTG